ncbi:YkvA family protein [Agrobacterium sp. 22094]|uniref:YkvA family protein n=1 Tax=Agrobacterium sp. 22094 TaxID=3453872 RepID=UPI003F8723CB
MDDVKIGEILLPGDPDTQKEREETVRSKFWPKMKRVVSKVPFARDAAAAYYCAVDPSTPLRAKGILLAALGYFIMPIDVVPDMLAVIGFTDDIAVLTAALAMIRAHIKMEHYDAADIALEKMREE